MNISMSKIEWRRQMMITQSQKPNSQVTDLWTEQLLRDGYCIIHDAASSLAIEMLNEMLDGRFANTPFCDGDFYGRHTKRFGALLNHSKAVADLISHPLILGITAGVLGPSCDTFNLNLTQGIEIHPGAPAQFPHRDEDMWQGAKGKIEYLLNVMWPLTEFTDENGATRIWPATHYSDALDLPPVHEPIVAEMSPGDALLFLGSTLHCAGANSAATVRRGLIVSYCLGWLKPFENQWLSTASSSAQVTSSSVDRWTPFMAEAAKKFGVPVAWIRAIMRVESGGQTMLNGAPITSSAGAMGLMQVMPDTYTEMQSRYGLGADPYDPHDNILAGVGYLREMYLRYGYPDLFAAYNAGPARLDTFLDDGMPLPPETTAYLEKLGQPEFIPAEPQVSMAQNVGNILGENTNSDVETSPKISVGGASMAGFTPSSQGLFVPLQVGQGSAQ
jgi:hypothetical protein